MAREFRLPDIGEGLTEAEIVRWLVAEGDHVEADQPVVEVETDKAIVEIPSPFAGIVMRHGGAEGQVILVGSVLVVIGDESDAAVSIDEPPFAPPAQPATSEVMSETPPAPQAAPIVGTLDDSAELIGAPVETAEGSSQRVKALPLVRKLARDAGVDIESIVGTGPGGRVTRQDVESAITPVAAPSTVDDEVVEETRPTFVEPTPAPPQTDSPTPVTREDERRSMSRLRRTIAANMSRSWEEIPHVTTFDDVDATRLMEVRSALGERHGVNIPIEALVVRAVLPALDVFPEFNSTLDGDELIIHGSHDIGIAVDTPEGLMVAVIANADGLSVLELATEVRRLGEGARGRTLTPGELTGQSFTVSNIGAVGGGHGTPIVPYGTTAILSVGRAKAKPIVDGDDLIIAPMMPLSLSYDHRVIDGGVGRRFMALLLENLAEPALFLAS